MVLIAGLPPAFDEVICIMESITHYQRPCPSNQAVVEQLVRITHDLTGDWFTDDVPEYLPRDLMYQDALCLEVDGTIASFIVFTSFDGSILVTLMGTDPGARGKGYGSKVMEALFDHARGLGFRDVFLWTVPPSVDQRRTATLGFYQKHGFVIEKEYKELWQNGALQLRKML